MTTEAQPFGTKSDWVYSRLREMIAAGDLPAGERLRLTQLAQRFQTSETPVREALRMLQRDGLVQMQSHRGAIVAVVDWDHVYEIVLIRMHLEVLATREAASHHTPLTLEPIAELLDRMDRLAERGRATAFSDANRLFHTMVYEPIGYGELKEQIQGLWERMWQTRSQSLFRMDRTRATLAQGEHRSMVEAIRERDAEGAASASQVHMERTLEAWRSIIVRMQAH